ncbi:DUF4129 domain-containing protein [Catenulispora sp. NF23]|uniref:DUF4129 domain-containing protein n=1 Tax=Catenulispora pinistramenti TaxID=2705254 RepID=UPI001BA97D11|nr:DUF4129 domain-containing protein [Catenulispora pinistramenti]MBS2536010.1 DUF4129 domain-containing protein [Catenulispora pinistramenti]
MTGNPRRWLPAAVVVIAVAAMAVAGRRDGGLDDGLANGLWKNGRPIAALLAAVALIVIAGRFARHRDDGYGLLHRAGTATAVLLYIAAVLTPIGLLFFGRAPGNPIPPPVDNGQGGSRNALPGNTMDIRDGKPHHGLDWADIIVVTVLSLIVAAIVALLVYGLIKLLSRIRLNRQPVRLIDFTPLDPDLEQLAEAVEAGAEALEYEGDAREAVIACYSAMELAVSAGGTSRRATDTPDEFLRRVTAARLIPEAPAGRLTELFHEARFSRHPITEAQRDEAREALRTISEHLRAGMAARAAALAAAQAGSQDTAQTGTEAGAGAARSAGRAG